MEPITVSTAEAQRLIGIGKTKLFELIADGRLTTVEIGRKRLVRISSIRRLLGEDVPVT
ncbi:helix-turn-helix domain-containing protein [Sphingomonas sp. LY160]|uniref:helix-turn-helix domain-containing protein n=1 Tax=Sphingomonas sp. LY160 TaxID=3095342 RepID=UPI002ADEADE4|nr:helix-turn-helix domain-containing protein [Sphingomonas sp. LY160]MEA1072187.1 helix-turn-helix domain-containing protein [Sphingomonas sp. LY160]